MGKIINFFEARNKILEKKRNETYLTGIDIEDWLLQNFAVSELLLEENGQLISVPVKKTKPASTFRSRNYNERQTQKE